MHCPFPDHKSKKAATFGFFEKGGHGLYKCHGCCQRSGDLVKWMVDYEGLSLPDAMREAYGTDPNWRPSNPPLSAYEDDAPAAEPVGQEITDYGEMMQFYKSCEKEIIYRPHLKQWLRFGAKTGWLKLDQESVAAEVQRFLAGRAADFLRRAEERFAKAKEAEKAGEKQDLQSIGKAFEAKAKALLSAGKRDAVIKMLRSRVSMPHQAPFCEKPYIIGLPDGMLYDARTRETRKQKPEDRVTMCLAVTPDRKMPLKWWPKYLKESFGDSEAIRWLLRFMGYSMLGYTIHHEFVFLHGQPRTGKSTLLFVIKFVFGTYQRPITSRTFIVGVADQHPTILANLDGPRVVTFSETKQSGRIDEEVLCNVVAGDQQSARKMHKDFYDFTPVCKLWFASTHYPDHQGKTSGFADRVRLLKFPNRREKKDQDPDLPQKLKAEAPAIAALLLEEASPVPGAGLARRAPVHPRRDAGLHRPGRPARRVGRGQSRVRRRPGGARRGPARRLQGLVHRGQDPARGAATLQGRDGVRVRGQARGVSRPPAPGRSRQARLHRGRAQAQAAPSRRRPGSPESRDLTDLTRYGGAPHAPAR